MRRFGFLLRAPWFTPCLGLILLMTRSMASLGASPARFPDSAGYETFSLFGQTDRPWAVTSLYALVPSETGRVAAQIILGSLAWLWLGIELSRNSRWPRLILILTTLLSLSPQVVRYDLAMLSESLGISYAVLAVAATLRRVNKPSRLTTSIWIISIALCASTRPTHLLIVVACCLPHVVRLISSRGRQLSIVGIAIFALLVLGVIQQRNSSHMSLLNLYTVVSSRVLSDDQRFEWFVSHGMPTVENMRSATGYDYVGELPPDIAAVVSLPPGQQPPALMRVGGVALAEWLKDSGWRILTLYLITHPNDTLSHAKNLLDPTLSPPNGDFLPLDNGPMIPGALYGQWQLWALCALAGTVLIAMRSRKDAVLYIAMAIITSVIYLATVHTSGIEHVRHSVTVSAMIRVIGLCALVRAIDPSQPSRRSVEDVSERT